VRGCGGVAFMIRRSDRYTVKELITDNEGIIGIQLCLANKESIYILGTHMPSSNQLDSVYLEYMYELFELYDIYSQYGPTLVVGDFNTDIRPRTRTKWKLRSRALHRLLTNRSLESAVPMCDNTFTYRSKDMSIKTLIDYVFVPDSAELDVVYATIVDSIPYSVSDHYLIKVSLKIRHATHISRTPHSSAVLKWKEASFDDKWLYKYESESSLRILPLDYNDTADVHTHIDEYIGVIIDSLKAAAIASIPVSNYRPYLKPYWTTSNLKENHTDMRSARRAWINNGRPRGLQDESYRRYKDFKRLFRRSHRNAKTNHEKDKINDIINTSEIDIKEFYRLARNHKRPYQLTEKLEVDNRCATGSRDICNMFGQYYQNLAKPTEDESFNSVHYQFVSDAVQEIVNDPTDTNNGIFHLPVTQEEIRDQLRLLKTGKAPGPDGIVNEHLKYAGHSLTIHLCRLFNLIIECEYMPHIFNLGHVLPIHKGKGKSKHDPSNYRGITLTSAIAILF
jgi:hypothetical protein